MTLQPCKCEHDKTLHHDRERFPNSVIPEGQCAIALCGCTQFEAQVVIQPKVYILEQGYLHHGGRILGVFNNFNVAEERANGVIAEDVEHWQEAKEQGWLEEDEVDVWGEQEYQVYDDLRVWSWCSDCHYVSITEMSLL